jgi:flagellar basal-body rod protein FlgF
MRTTSYLALSRQVVLDRHMTTIANNLANATTSGYRAEHTVFEQTLERVGRGARAAFVQDVSLARDLTPGPVEQTGNPLDVALVGGGYLAFATADGTRYGRSGRLAIDAEGRLVNAAGRRCSTTAATRSRSRSTSARSPSPATARSPAATARSGGSA